MRGHSWGVTLPRRLLTELRWLPGDWVYVYRHRGDLIVRLAPRELPARAPEAREEQ